MIIWKHPVMAIPRLFVIALGNPQAFYEEHLVVVGWCYPSSAVEHSDLASSPVKSKTFSIFSSTLGAYVWNVCVKCLGSHLCMYTCHKTADASFITTFFLVTSHTPSWHTTNSNFKSMTSSVPSTRLIIFVCCCYFSCVVYEYLDNVFFECRRWKKCGDNYKRAMFEQFPTPAFGSLSWKKKKKSSSIKSLPVRPSQLYFKMLR